MTVLNRRHGLHVYRTTDHLAASIAGFALAGLQRGDPAVLVPAAEHRGPVLGALQAAGVDVPAAMAANRLVVADADELAARCAAAGSVDEVWRAFTALLANLRQGGRLGVTVWGETPDRLLKTGHEELYRDLETRWAAWTTEDPHIDLLCSCEADLLGEALYDGVLQEVCALHTHVFTVEDAFRLTEVIDAAAADVLGPRMAGMAWALADASRRPTAELPLPFARLLWLKAQMPHTWQHVVAVARLKVGARR